MSNLVGGGGGGGGRWLGDSKPAELKIYIWSPSHF